MSNEMSFALNAHTHLVFGNTVRYAFDMPEPFYISLEPMTYDDRQVTTNTKSNSSFSNGRPSRLQITPIIIEHAAVDARTHQLACTHFTREPKSEELRWDKSGWRGTKSRPVECRSRVSERSEEIAYR
jgi:hypothetical protein